MRKFRLYAEGYIDAESEFEYKHINNFREVFPLLHDHDYFEFFLVIDGAIEHFVNNRKFQLGKGHMLFIRPTDVHSLNVSSKSGCHFVNLAVLRRTIDDMFEYLGYGLDRERLLNSEFPPSVLLSAGELNSLVSKLDRLNTLPVNDKGRLNTELRVILIQLVTEYFEKEADFDQEMPEWLKQTIDALQDPGNFLSGLPSVRDIACKSDEHISRTFKKYLGKTPTQYINELRLNFAANQIRFTSKKISEICYEAGFENQSNFHRLFKSTFGYTPYQFRKMHLRQHHVA